MKSRKLRGGIGVLASSMFLLIGTASASAAPAPTTCVVKSLPSFTAQGEEKLAATVGDVIEVECNPVIFGTDCGRNRFWTDSAISSSRSSVASFNDFS